VKWILPGAALLSWALGGYAVYVTSAQFSGRGVAESYAAFEAGSNLGNVLWFLLWTGASAVACWILVRKAGPGAVRAVSYTLYGYGTPATLLVFPDAAMSFAVSHVRASTDSTAPHSSVVEVLVISGGVAVVCAALLSLAISIRERHRPAPTSGR
jgi:hypothetical protein